MGRRTAWAVGAATLALLAGGCSWGTSIGGPTDSPPAQAKIQRYVALGDSYTAAPGVPAIDPADPCLQSSRSYPHLVAAALAPAAFADPSCSGAKTADVTGAQQTGSGPRPPQLDAVTADTDVVSIGLGGNDFGLFTTLVTRCSFVAFDDPTGSPCRAVTRTAGGGDELLDRLPIIQRRLEAVVSAVRDRAARARILLVGYPQLVPATGSCTDRLPIAVGDYPYARSINRGLDQAVRAAATATGAIFVDVWTASAGHDICAGQPWINGRERSSRAASYHPFAVEQAAVARLVVDAVGA